MSTPFWRSAPVENPESSIRLRSSVLTTVLIATLAIVNEGLVGSAATIAALVGIPIGFWWSHARRHRESALLKLGIAVALIFALVGFVESVSVAQSLARGERAQVGRPARAQAGLPPWVGSVEPADRLVRSLVRA